MHVCVLSVDLALCTALAVELGVRVILASTYEGEIQLGVHL